MRGTDDLIAAGSICRTCLHIVTLALALLAPCLPGPAAAEPSLGPTVASGLSVQFTDKFLKRPDWRERLGLVSALGATMIRIDMNWPWIETRPGRYSWELYDDLADELQRRGLRPIFILNRPNALHGARYAPMVDGDRDVGVRPPSTRTEIAAFARWAAAASYRYRRLSPIWEIWNEPDQNGFWPPEPDPGGYVTLARETCVSIRKHVPDATISGPGLAQMPTVWLGTKPMLKALLDDSALLDCLDAISLHTHRFKQRPETVSRDYAVLRQNYLDRLPPAASRKPIIDTEWGDSVYGAGISEDTQALWLPRMVLINLMEQVRLTNWYCLMDVGPDDDEMEDRFGLVRQDGSTRPAYQAFRTLSQQVGGLSLRETIRRFETSNADGITILRFCDTAEKNCKLVFWSTEGVSAGASVAVPGWRMAGPAIDHLGRQDVSQQNNSSILEVRPTTSVRYLPIVVSP